MEWNTAMHSTATVNIAYTTIEYATNGIYGYFNNDLNSILNIDHSTIQNNTKGINLYYGKVNLQSQNKIINNTQYGFYLEQDSDCTFGSSASEWNIISDNASYDFYNHCSNDIMTQYVYWGTADSTLIAEHIYDKDDESWRGLVDFTNFLTSEPGGGPIAPANVQISVAGTQITLTWDAVTGATYKIYSSDDPITGFTEETGGTFNGTSWIKDISGIEKKFYHVKAIN